MRVVQILPRLDLGGVEKGTVELAKYLALHGDYPIIISGGGKLEIELKEYGIKHYKLPVYRKSPLSLFLVPQLFKIFKKEDVDIVHARSRAPAWIAYIAFKKYHGNCPLYKFSHFVPSFITTAHGYYRKHFFSKIMGKGKLVICPSRIISKHMIQDFSIPYKKIRIIPRGVNLKDYKFILPSEKDWEHLIIAIIARITPIKGHLEFIKAMRFIVRNKPFARGWIIGSPSPGKEDYLKDLQLAVRRYGLENSIEFLGARYDIPDLLEKINILVSASYVPEAFGRTIIEAQAAGVPVVASRVGGVIELIRNYENGILYSPKDDKELANSILKIIKNRNLADIIAKEARKEVEEKYQLNHMNEKTVKVYKEMGRSLNILVIKLSALGDCILSIPSLRAIRNEFKNAHITLVTGAKVSSVFENCPYIDNLIILSLRNNLRKYFKILEIVKILRKTFWDFSIDLQNNKISHLISFLSGVSQRFGFSNNKFSFLLNKKVKLPSHPLLPVDQQFLTLQKIGIKAFDKKLELWIPEETLNKMKDFIKANWIAKHQILVGINIGASKTWNSKKLKLDKITKLIDSLAKFNIRTVITGSIEDIELSQDIYNLSNYKPINAVGKTNLVELSALIKLCHAYLTSDSACLHIASAVGTPVLAIFGPTDPRRHLPPGKDVIWIWKKIKCSPCYKPNCKDNICITKIPLEEIEEKLLELTKRKENAHFIFS
jgi:lipopolysaccharide heptosyltransferase II